MRRWTVRIGNPTEITQRAAEFVFSARRKLVAAGLVAVALLLASHVIFGANGMLVFERKRAEYRKLQQEDERLQKENERISQRIRELNSDPKAIEREAREQLRYTRPGEVVYVLPEPALPQPPSNATAQKR